MIRKILLFSALCFATRSEAIAQIRGAESCAAATVFNQDRSVIGANNLDRMHPLIARARYASDIEQGDWAGGLQALREDAAQAFAQAGVDEGARARFFAQVDSTIVAVRRLPPQGDPARAAYVDSAVRPARFQPSPGGNSFTLFRFSNLIAVGDLPQAQARALCWSALSAGLILFRIQTPLEGASISRLGRLTGSWTNYREYGYTRQPIEMLIWRGNARDSLPPLWQGLLAHLSAGMELRGGAIDSLRATGATAVEFGVLRYRSNYTQYSGVSVVLALASGRTIGAGPVIHLARGLRAGYVLRRENGSVRGSVLLSSDLFGLLQRSKSFAEEGLSLARGRAILPADEER